MGAIYDEFEKQLRAKLMIQQMSFFFFLPLLFFLVRTPLVCGICYCLSK